jgi:hypothetical protein
MFQVEQETGLIEAFADAVAAMDGVKAISLSPDLETPRVTEADPVKCRQLLAEIEASDAAAFWASIQALMAEAPFDVLRRRMIVVCEGEQGWQDYRLLQHYDASQKTAALAGQNAAR